MTGFFSKESNSNPAAYSAGAPLKESEFEKIRRLVYDRAGISLGSHKKDLVRTRLQKRLRVLNLGSYGDYYDYVVNHDESGSELIHMLDAISTNKTDFFRENQHFEFLRNEALPKILELKNRRNDNRLRFWSAGCSTGEEPYTLSMVLHKALANTGGWDLKILATDISTRALERAVEGVYTEEQTAGIPGNIRSEVLTPVQRSPVKVYSIADKYRRVVSFRRLNLMDPQFPFKGLFDVIFCRNVMIYFDKPTQEALVNKFYRYLQPGGYLLIGHSESLAGATTSFKYVRPTVYLKT